MLGGRRGWSSVVAGDPGGLLNGQGFEVFGDYGVGDDGDH